MLSLSTHLLVLVAKVRQIIMQCEVRILVLPETLRNAIYSGARRNATRVMCVHDHKVEIESDAERMVYMTP